MAGETLERGDIIRLPNGHHSYDDKSKPLDLMICEPPQDSGMSLMFVSGWDAGVTLAYLPKESRGLQFRNSIDVSWLIENWSDWFAYEGSAEKLERITLEGVLVMRRQEYRIDAAT
ncbi:Imm45 family immunity protein [Mesorhizobium sp. IMUNJ 23232]|uniref:Imm45 family immunity protein n=1 Tax=Mesorhizobium sp. IMUNJ 23232 TaxID=3376064 RepID=UPI0037B6599A